MVCSSYAPEATKCLERKRETTLKLESKIEAGIERYIHTEITELSLKNALFYPMYHNRAF